jgi:hypothetical protein
MLFNSSRAKFVTTLILASSLSIVTAQAAQAVPFWQRFLPRTTAEMPEPQQQTNQELPPVEVPVVEGESALINGYAYPNDGTPIRLEDGRCSRIISDVITQTWQSVNGTCPEDINSGDSDSDNSRKPSWWPF